MKTSTLQSLMVAVQHSGIFQSRKFRGVEIVPTTLVEKSLVLRDKEKRRRRRRMKLEE